MFLRWPRCWQEPRDRLLAAARARGSLELGRLLALHQSDVAAMADVLMALLDEPLDPPTTASVRNLLHHPSRLLATLASDVLNRAGEPAVPGFVRSSSQPVRDPLMSGLVSGSQAWEARIDVDGYAFYEATHPGYAEQVHVMAEFIRRFSGDPAHILDIGSGAGLPTVMLSELFPQTRLDAVEPSTTAFAHLSQAVAGRCITAHHCGVEDLPRMEGVEVITSVGASHHLDTRVFLENLYDLVAPGGLVIVADEMVSEFIDTDGRSANLIEHHFAYIDEALGSICPETLNRSDRERLQAFRCVRRREHGSLHVLLGDLLEANIAGDPTAGSWQRIEFAVLELQALVAGLDYEVERKTYPSNFIAMARDAGLEILEHHRVYPTVGASELDAGTHVFALWRPR